MRTKQEKRRKLFKEIITTIVMLIGVFAVRSSLAEPYVVPTGSMEPTILPGDRLIVSKLAYDIKVPFLEHVIARCSAPKRGDVIVFRYPKDPSISFVKRLIGLPGDVVSVADGNITINGRQALVAPSDTNELESNTEGVRYFKEDFDGKSHLIQRLPHQVRLGRGEVQRYVVPVGYYFFMGDNRDNSNDSRYWGFVSESYIKGKVLGVWLSLDTAHGGVPRVRLERFGKGV